jgi:4-amino-4-deoxy-L-arabinose transferase-like glycosyltransferase
LLVTAGVVLWYAACRRLFSRRAAWFAGFFAATMCPVVFYAHTTNVDGPMVFWSMLAMYG